jgi:hypothetical protein
MSHQPKTIKLFLIDGEPDEGKGVRCLLSSPPRKELQGDGSIK